MDRRPATIHPHLTLAGVLARVRIELVDLSCCADALQVTIGAIVDSVPSALPLEAQIQLQAADALSQRLVRLARLASALEAQAPRGLAIDDAPSGELAVAYSRVGDASATGRPPQDEGEFEVF